MQTTRKHPFVKQTLSGWGRMPAAECCVYRPEKRREQKAILRSGEQTSFIARGRGRSYGDTSVNADAGVILVTRLNRMLAFDPDTGVLECEAGVGPDEIIDVFLPRGFFLPVTPGTKFVTVGGAIANDVHGKNHHRDGTFSRFVLDFTLLTPGQGVITCSRDENADVFWATTGGIGLTGIILTARIELAPVQTAYIKVDYRRAENLDAALASMAELDNAYRYSVAWVDCLARGASLGRSVLMYGEHASVDDLPTKRRGAPFRVKPRLALNVPVDLPGLTLNSLSVKAFNQLFYKIHPTAEGKVVDYDRYFYPLDSVLNWNRIYGKRGFVQFQASLPGDSAEGLVELLERLSESKRASFLAVLKAFGPAGQGLLSHPIPGYTLTLDIPNRRGLEPFLTELETITLDRGGRLYLAKDAVAAPHTIAAMYDTLDRFREVKARLDPQGVLSSSMSRRLGLDARMVDASMIED